MGIESAHMAFDSDCFSKARVSTRSCTPACTRLVATSAVEPPTEPAWITGFEHRIDTQNLGARDLTVSPSTAASAQAAGAEGADVVELHAPFSHQELILRQALRLNGSASVNPSGGALAANPMFAAGLTRIGEAATRVWSGDAGKAVAHATSGPCLQQNLVCVMEASHG